MGNKRDINKEWTNRWWCCWHNNFHKPHLFLIATQLLKCNVVPFHVIFCFGILADLFSILANMFGIHLTGFFIL
jgi:hypothetical protein